MRGPRIGLSLSLASADDRTWHADVGIAGALVAELDRLGLWFDFERMAIGGEPEPVDRDRLLAAARAWQKGNLELFAAEPHAAYASISTGGVLADLRLETPSPSSPAESTLDGLITWVRAAASVAAGHAGVQIGCVYPIDLVLPQRRPPVTHELVRFGALVDFFGVRWCEEVMPDAMEAVVTAELPPGVTRTRDGDLVVIRWIADPANPGEVARACAQQEAWWAVRIGTVEAGWNEYGDQEVVPTSLEPRAPFTLFDADEGVGYRAIVVLPDGEIDGASWAEIEQLVLLREVEGIPVHRVRLIVPVREDAVAIAGDARRLGVDAVVYRGDDENLWSVTP
jgi:hypothetical protein